MPRLIIDLPSPFQHCPDYRLGVFVRALRSAYRRQARRHGLAGGETGMVTSVQRFGGALNLDVHFHTLVLDCVFVRVLSRR